MEAVYFRTDASPLVRLFTSDGRIDFSALGRRFKLDPTSIELNGSIFSEKFFDEGLKSTDTWTTIKNTFRREDLPDGTKENPIVVTGSAPVHVVPTGTLSWTEWLRQQLPPHGLGFSNAPGFRKVKDKFTPASTVEWNLWPDVDQYVEGAGGKNSRPQRINIEDELGWVVGSSNEADCGSVYKTFLGKMCKALLGVQITMVGAFWSRSSSMSQQPTTADSSIGADSSVAARDVSTAGAMELARSPALDGHRADILLKCSGRVFLVVEMKRPSFFRLGKDQRIPDLVRAYESKDLEYQDEQRSHVIAQSVTQLFGYMVAHELGYGILSTVDLSYFVSRVGDTLRISGGIDWCHPKFIGALAYFLEMAAADTKPYKWEGGHKDPQDCDIVDSEGTQDGSTDQEEYEPPKTTKTTTSARVSTRSMKGVSGLMETPAAHLHLEAHPFARGWSGNIVRGTYEGHAVAVKLAVVCSNRAEALKNEASAYLKLRKYWGRYVPALILHGTTADGNVVYIATKLINGFELGIVRLTQEVVIACIEALNAIHASGVLHGDIRRENILVPKGGRRGVRFIDFGFARFIASAEDCFKEREQLRKIITKFTSEREIVQE